MLYRIINALDEFPDFTTEAEHTEAGCANSVLKCYVLITWFLLSTEVWVKL